MKSNEARTTLKHLESFHGNVKNLSKRMKMKIKENVTFNLRINITMKFEYHINTRRVEWTPKTKKPINKTIWSLPHSKKKNLRFWGFTGRFP